MDLALKRSTLDEVTRALRTEKMTAALARLPPSKERIARMKVLAEQVRGLQRVVRVGAAAMGERQKAEAMRARATSARARALRQFQTRKAYLQSRAARTVKMFRARIEAARTVQRVTAEKKTPGYKLVKKSRVMRHFLPGWARRGGGPVELAALAELTKER